MENKLGEDLLTRHPGIDSRYRHPSDPYGRRIIKGALGATIRVVSAPSAWRRSLARVAIPKREGVGGPKGEKGEEDWRCAWAHAPNTVVQWWGRSVSLRAGRCGAISL